MYAEVILPLKLSSFFTYLNKVNAKRGDLVEVSFGNKSYFAIVFSTSDTTEIKNKDKCKEIIKIIKRNFYSNNLLEFLEFFAKYNQSSLSLSLANALPAKNILSVFNPNQTKKTIKDKESRKEILHPTNISLTLPQENALEDLKTQHLNSFSASLLQGITGSGKTEIYFSFAKYILSQEPSSQLLILLPEILLTNKFTDRAAEFFGYSPDIWHSDEPISKKKKTLLRIINGETKLIIGARSALFLPFANLKLIVIDEEHDQSYKQDDILSYNARDMAILRAKKENFPIILSSATPSLETKYNAIKGKYKEILINERFGDAILPETSIIDMKKEYLKSGKFISPSLIKEIENNLTKGNQILLFLNKKGYAPLKICTSCGHKIECPSCDSYLVEHKKEKKLICHQCGFEIQNITDCPKCLSEKPLISFGPGVEKIAEEVSSLFPEATSIILTSDTVKKENDIKSLYSKIERNEIQIIIGTQIISKGHHFPHLKLVAVIDGDISHETDFRSNEKMLQLLSQVAGRAGRENSQGKVLIQTYSPNQIYLHALQNSAFLEFYHYEIKSREKSFLPPFSKIINIIIQAKNADLALEKAKELKLFLKDISIPDQTNEIISILGPAKATIFKVRNFYRYKIALKMKRNTILSQDVLDFIRKLESDKKTRIKLDVDPQNFY